MMFKDLTHNDTHCSILQNNVAVPTGTPVKQVIPWFFNENRLAIAVIRKGEVIGIISRNDIIHNYYDGLINNKTTVDDVMTRDPIVHEGQGNASDMVDFIDEKHVRHIPVTDENGNFIGVTHDLIILKEAADKARKDQEETKQFFLGLGHAYSNTIVPK